MIRFTFSQLHPMCRALCGCRHAVSERQKRVVLAGDRATGRTRWGPGDVFTVWDVGRRIVISVRSCNVRLPRSRNTLVP